MNETSKSLLYNINIIPYLQEIKNSLDLTPEVATCKITFYA